MVSLKVGIIKWYSKSLFSKRNIIIMLTLTVMSLVSIVVIQDNLTYKDLLALQFWGQGIGTFNLLYFLRLLVYNGIPLYLLSYFLEKENRDRNLATIIRLKSKKKWLTYIVILAAVFIVIYLILTIITSVMIGVLFGLNFSGYKYLTDLFSMHGLEPLSLPYLLLIILSSKGLELFFSFLVVFTTYIYIRGVTPGFVFVQLMYFLGFFMGGIIIYLPFGMSSLSRMSEFTGDGGVSYVSSIVFLIILNSIICFFLQFKAYKRIFN
ncbi:MAG: hypothetical protein ACLKAN_12920 [Alkaliphilus sp.]